MLKKLLFVLTISAASALGVHAISAQENYIDPEANCKTVLAGDTDAAAIWAFGYLANQIDNPRSVNPDMIEDFLGDYREACDGSPQDSFVAVLNRLINGPDPDRQDTDDAIIEEFVPAVGMSLIEMFDHADLDLVTVLRALAPSPKEVHAVFPTELALSLVERYEEAFGPELDQAGFPQGQPVVTSTFTTTFELKNHPLLDELRGGYKDIVNLYLVDVPFAQIVLTYPEIEDHVNLAGLIYINNRWTIMPRPWRGL